MAIVAVEQFTDPFSPWCWAAQPTLRRLRYAFRDDVVTWTPRTTVLLPGARPGTLPRGGVDGAVYADADDVGAGDTDDEGADDEGADDEDAGDEDADERRARWAEVAGGTGMPVADDPWAEGLPPSRAACAAVAFVRETTPGRALAVLRRLGEAAFVDGRAIVDPDEVAAVAGTAAGVEARSVRRGLEDGRAADALEADLERALAVADEVSSGTVEVRGDVSLLPAAGRVDTGRAGSGGENATAAGSGGDSDDHGSHGETEVGGDEPRLLGPPALRIERRAEGDTETGAGAVTVADPRLPYGRLATAFGRSLPKTGIGTDDKYATSRMAMHVPPEVAESLSAQDFAAEVRPYLSRFGRAYLPEVVAGTGLSRDTCLDALEALVARDEAERVGPAEWRIVDEPGGPGRDT